MFSLSRHRSSIHLSLHVGRVFGKVKSRSAHMKTHRVDSGPTAAAAAAAAVTSHAVSPSSPTVPVDPGAGLSLSAAAVTTAATALAVQ